MSDMRKLLFRGWPGCSNHGCIVTGPKKGMGTNGMCTCVAGASRSALQMLHSRLAFLVDESPSHYAVIDEHGEIVQAFKVASYRDAECLCNKLIKSMSENHDTSGWTVKGVTIHD